MTRDFWLGLAAGMQIATILHVAVRALLAN